MKNRTYFIILFLFTFLIINERCYCNDYHLPIKCCTSNKGLNEFFSEFHLDKINKIVLKFINVDKGNYDTINTFKDNKEINKIVSELYNIKCIRLSLAASQHELWLYENENLRLKLALAIGSDYFIVNVYKPDESQESDNPINNYEFAIENEEFSSWLFNNKK